jgi:hypothetical protein
VAHGSWSSLLLGAAMLLAVPSARATDIPPSTTAAATYLDQGWSKEIRELFYFTPQGSRIIPYVWFMALERPDGQGMFADPAHLERYGFIPSDSSHALNPGSLPIGFAIDPTEAPRPQYEAFAVDPAGSSSRLGPQLGLTCAACHTASVTVEGRPVRIDGAPANLDFDSFYADLAAAVTHTFFDQAAFQRFAARVLGEPSSTGVAELRLLLAEFEAKIAGDAAIRRPTLPSGFGRVDALTQIVNALAVTDQSDPLNLRPVNAPTSYPQLWLTPKLEFVQWNPIAASPIGRNGGEVLGVFGEATLTGDPQGWFASSLRIRDLHALETWVADLKPPRWEEAVFGPADPESLAGTGGELFRQHCTSCHNTPPYRHTDPAVNLFGKTFIEIGRVDYRKVGTDPAYVESLVQRLVRTNAATAQAVGGAVVTPAPTYFISTAGAIVTRAMNEAGLSEAEKAEYSGFRLRPPAAPGGQPRPYLPPSLTDLKAGPLPGIWASGPYLHNGSVPTVYELLSPVEERRKVFWTGGRELDRERLGFVSDDAPGRFRFDTSLPGNRNTGHLYPPQGLSPDERKAIVAYLRTL